MYRWVHFAPWLATRTANRPGSADQKWSRKLTLCGLPRRLSSYVLVMFCSALPQFMANPATVSASGTAGWLFHGGLIGVIVVMIIFAVY
ncbi:hypothetical protein ACNKHL_17190 [Shigella flexneri]